MALYGVFCQIGISPLDGEPLHTLYFITSSEAEAIEQEKKCIRSGLIAWYEQIQ